MNSRTMKYVVTGILIMNVLTAGAQEITEMLRMPSGGAGEYVVGAQFEPKKKPQVVVLGADGKAYLKENSVWKGYATGIEASDLRYVMDKKGTLYVTGRAGNGIAVWESSDLGQTWERAGEYSAENAEYYTTYCNMKSGDLHLIYAVTEGEGEDCRAYIRMVSTGNAGKKWTDPVQLDSDGSGCHQIMASIASFKDGKLFSIWSNGGTFKFDRSYDNDRWLRNDIPVTNDLPELSANGKLQLVMDNSDSQLAGMLYLSGVSKNDSTMVAWIRSSGKLGDTWTSPASLKPDYAGSQYFPHITVDNTTGALFAAWLGVSDGMTEVWFGYSLDAGKKFESQKLASWDSTGDMDHFSKPVSVAAHGGSILITWIESNGTELVQKAAEFSQDELFDLGGK